jgi:hypothetical protein
LEVRAHDDDSLSGAATSKRPAVILGHPDATTTLNTYADLWPDRLDDVSDAMALQRSLALGDPITTTALGDDRAAPIMTGS